MREILQDARFAGRLMRRAPGFAATVVLTIALGVGANVAIFSAVNAVLLQPLPFADGGRLVSLWGTNPDKSIPRFGVSYPDFHDWSERTHSFSGMSLYTSGLTTMIGPSGPESVAAMFVTRNFLGVLGVRPMKGRDFGADDERGETSNTVIISHGFWQRRFASDRSIIGRTVSVGGRSRTIIGVLPPDAALLGPAFLGVPLDVVMVVQLTTYPSYQLHAQHLFGAIGRLKPGVTLDEARRDLYDTEVRISRENSGIAGWTASAFYLSDDFSLSSREPLLILLAASALLLLIGCINVANLLLVRGASRARELALRQAIGASRYRIGRQLVIEAIVLSVAGGAIGVALAAAALRFMRSMLPVGVIARADQITLNGRVLLFALALSLVTAVAFGLWPAIRSGAFRLATALREGGQGAAGVVRPAVRRTLVVAEISLALVLLICAGLVMRSVRRMLRVDPGFAAEHVVTAQITLGADYPDSSALPFYRMLLASLDAKPGIIAAGATDTPPLAGGGILPTIYLPGEPRPPGQAPLQVTMRAITPGFFKAMGIRMLEGADVAWDESKSSMLVSETGAKVFWKGKDAVGKEIAFLADSLHPYPVVGAVSDVRQASLSAAPVPVVYVSMRRTVRLIRTMTLVVRSNLSMGATVSAIRDAVRQQDPRLPLYNVQTMQDIVDQSTAQARLNLALLSVFAAAAMVLAALGIYGVVSYSVTQRRREIGVRIALGAQQADVLRLVLTEGVAMGIAGVSLGTLGALFATRLIRAWLFEIGPADPGTFAVVAVGLVGVAVTASYLPARRAAAVDPLRAIRE